LGYTNGPNPYGFAGNDPVNASDPMGLCLGLNNEPCYQVADRIAEKLKKAKEAVSVDGDGWGSIGVNTATGTAIDAVETFFVDPLRAGQATGDAVGSDAGTGQIILAVVQDTGRAASLAAGAGTAVKSAGKLAKVVKTATTLEKDAVRLTQTGSRTVQQYLKELEEAEKAYAVIRKTDDVAKISKETGIPEHQIARIKDHIFNRVHQLDEGVRQFDADPKIAQAWQRLQKGTQTADDIKLLKHELFESKFEGIFKTDYRTAHEAAERAGRPSGIGSGD